jgi:polysaccharide export outer membrane protein
MMKKIIYVSLLICFIAAITSLVVAQDQESDMTILEANGGQPVEDMSEGFEAEESEIDDALIRPTDMLEIDVYNEQDLTKTVEVDKKGFITYPLIGRVKVEELTKDEAETKIYELFEKDYLVNPQITLRILHEEEKAPAVIVTTGGAEDFIEEEVILSSYIILGEIRKPGTYEFNPEKGTMTLLKAISIAGGFTDIANMGKIKMLRRDGAETRAYTVSAKNIISGKRPDEEIHDEDLIVVAESLI